MKAMDSAWPFLPEVRLFHERGRCERFLHKHGREPRFLGVGAQTWYFDETAVVLIECDASWHAEAALLVHEAYHAVMAHFSELGEEHPSEEFVAYGVQVVSRALFEAHEKWKRKVDG